MRVLSTVAGAMMLCASVVSAAGTFMVRVRVESFSEPAGLLALGVGFVLLARPVRRKKSS